MPRKPTKEPSRKRSPLAWLRRWSLWTLITGALVMGAASLWHGFVAPPGPTFYMKQEARRLGQIAYVWTPIDDIAPVMARAAVAAEDANFCNHWGFDMRAIREVLERGGARGASTISQQTVKNVYLWHGRSWPRKALEAAMTPVVETAWSKRRIIEVYLNVAEFDEGIFGVGAAARHYFGVNAADLTDRQAARLAAILPDPKNRSASQPSDWVRKRAASIMDGAATIRRDGRAACFED
ncbi:monofunctional biosynthetic peptidoglycan transglycosylase [Roseovarius sp. D0-M9]|uniref:monofunctional biosynthetic peptidoglycan transglycosylase n=1 Tax=Roseovarius sp. D0-M9 TaxID=3127117 RepID=UPI00300FF4B2